MSVENNVFGKLTQTANLPQSFSWDLVKMDCQGYQLMDNKQWRNARFCGEDTALKYLLERHWRMLGLEPSRDKQP